jgi:hypothetical protein
MQTSITGKHDDPWLNLWLKALQPGTKYFTHESSIHEAAHVARVLNHMWIIGIRYRGAKRPKSFLDASPVAVQNSPLI